MFTTAALRNKTFKFIRTVGRITLKACFFATTACSLSLGAFYLTDYALVKFQKYQIRRALTTKQKFEFEPVLGPVDAPASTMRSLIDKSLTPVVRKYPTVIHGVEGVGKSAYVSEQIKNYSEPGVRYVDVKKIAESLEDKSMVLPTALAQAMNLNLRYVGYDEYSRLLTRYKPRPEAQLRVLLEMLDEATDKIYKKKGYMPIIVLDNLHDDVIASLGNSYNLLATQAVAPRRPDAPKARFVFVTNGNYSRSNDPWINVFEFKRESDSNARPEYFTERTNELVNLYCNKHLR